MIPLRQFLYWSLPSSILLLLQLQVVTAASSLSPILCSDGFGGQEKRAIPAERINDGYCDCPADGGIDELGTDACSGSMDWSGVSLFTDSDSDIPPKRFQCAQQPDLQIPLSHVSDGICDCCDGSDESQTQQQIIQCPDNCAALFQAERLAKADLIERYTNGSAKRAEHQTLYHTFTQSTMDEIGVLTDDTIPKWREELRVVEDDIYANRLTSIRHRFELVVEVFEYFLTWRGGRDDHGNVPGSVGQLEQFIVAGCRLAGEIMMLDGGDGTAETTMATTCMPLKLSGMDLGFVWEEDGEVRRGGCNRGRCQ